MSRCCDGVCKMQSCNTSALQMSFLTCPDFFCVSVPTPLTQNRRCPASSAAGSSHRNRLLCGARGLMLFLCLFFCCLNIINLLKSCHPAVVLRPSSTMLSSVRPKQSKVSCSFSWGGRFIVCVRLALTPCQLWGDENYKLPVVWLFVLGFLLIDT